jgi:hypothetical protein
LVGNGRAPGILKELVRIRAPSMHMHAVRQYAVPCGAGSYVHLTVYTVRTVQVCPRYGTSVYGIDACVVLRTDCAVIEVDGCRAT